VIDYAVCPTANVYDIIIVPTDGSEAARDATDHGVCQAAAHDARLVFLAVVEMSGTAAPEAHDSEALEQQRVTRRDEAESLVAEAESAGVEAECVVETGVPSRVILEQAATRGADLVVMATSARSGVGRFLYGSVTEQVIRDGDTPVLAIQR
jgi:nucleotide-binding universal stress UspA family protein